MTTACPDPLCISGGMTEGDGPALAELCDSSGMRGKGGAPSTLGRELDPSGMGGGMGLTLRLNHLDRTRVCHGWAIQLVLPPPYG